MDEVLDSDASSDENHIFDQTLSLSPIVHDSDSDESQALIGQHVSSLNRSGEAPTASTSTSNITRWTSSSDITGQKQIQPVSAPIRPYYGMTGVNNMGNTCYLSAVLQCLANTRELRDYFLSKLIGDFVNFSVAI